MEILIAIIVIGVIAGIIQYIVKHKRKGKQPEANSTKNLNIENAYQMKWLLSYNEKEAFFKIKKATDEKGLFLFTKVRLLDLIEPKSGIENYKAYFYKIQAKHVDFVICNSKLVAKMIIELDDSSHNTEERKQRDEFVDIALKQAGYTVIHTKAIDETTTNAIMNYIA